MVSLIYLLIFSQLALFHVAESDLLHVIEMAEQEDDEERSSLRLRMAANAYFTTYDYIYEPYVSFSFIPQL